MLNNRLSELGPIPVIALVALTFWFWWPIGLATLGYLSFSRRRNGTSPGQWFNASQGSASTPNNRPGGNYPGNNNSGWGGWGGRFTSTRQAPPAGNRAFDEYRAETLRRLEEEQQEFVEYLERLRQARDKSEFDAFMADRRGRGAPERPVAEQA